MGFFFNYEFSVKQCKSVMLNYTPFHKTLIFTCIAPSLLPRIDKNDYMVTSYMVEPKKKKKDYMVTKWDKSE